MPTDDATLRELASKVKNSSDWWRIFNLNEYFPDSRMTRAERRLIAACDPQTILALLDDKARLQARAEAAENEVARQNEQLFAIAREIGELLPLNIQHRSAVDAMRWFAARVAELDRVAEKLRAALLRIAEDEGIEFEDCFRLATKTLAETAAIRARGT